MRRLLTKFSFCSRFFNEPTIPVADFDRLKHLQVSFKQQYGLGQYKEALDSCDQYITLTKMYYEEGHPALLSMLNNKAIIYNKIGNSKEALAILEQVANQYTSLFGPDHKSTMIALINLAKSLRMNGEVPQAQKLLEDVITLALSKEEAGLVREAKNNLAACYRQQKDKETKAIEIYNDLLEEDSLKPIEKANLHNDLGLVYKTIRDFEQAEGHYLKCLDLIDATLQREHPFFLTVYHNLGELYQAWQKKEQAQTYYSKALEQIQKRTQI